MFESKQKRTVYLCTWYEIGYSLEELCSFIIRKETVLQSLKYVLRPFLRFDKKKIADVEFYMKLQILSDI